MRRPPFHVLDWIEITVTLRHLSPPIWRKLQLPAELPLDLLHEALQIAFGWTNSHLHGFELGELQFAPHDEENEMLAIAEDGTPIGALLLGETRPVYAYDFGDGWEHEITFGAVVPPAPEGIVCVDGARACPPEDCGGPPGYEGVVAALADAAHPQHAEVRKWVGKTWAPEAVDLAAVAKKLRALSRRIGLARKPAGKGTGGRGR